MPGRLWIAMSQWSEHVLVSKASFYFHRQLRVKYCITSGQKDGLGTLAQFFKLTVTLASLRVDVLSQSNCG